MKRIWSPWRMKYIQKHEKDDECIFCLALKRPDDPENLVVYQGKRAFVIVNRFPYASGHLMVVPNAHQPDLDALDNDTRSELIELLSQTESVLRRVYRPDGFNIGANIGAAAGAGVIGHFHFHVVPRWVGDTNFMSTLGEIRVLPEELEETHHKLKDAWQ